MEKNTENKNKKLSVKKVFSIIGNVLLYLFLAICVFALVLTIFSKRDADGAAEMFGYQMRIVETNSMGECELTDVSGYDIKSIPVRSMIFVKMIPDDAEAQEQWYRELKVGDVLTFRYVYTTQVTITHRISSITEKPTGGFIIELAGDNKTTDDGQLYQTIDTSVPNSPNYVIGKVVGQSYPFGVVVNLLKSPAGIIFIIIVPCLIIILLEIVRIFNTVMANKKEKYQAEKKEKDDELEELRRRLAQLEGSGKGPDAASKTAEENDNKESGEE